MDSDGANQTQLSPALNEFEGEADLSPDGRRIVFEATRQGTRGIYVMNSDGTGMTQIVSGLGNFFFLVGPQWSADGSQIAYEHSQSGNNDRFIRIITSAGQVVRSLNADMAVARDFDVSWSPSGTQLVAERLAKSENSTGRTDLVLLPAAGGAGTRLTSGPNGHGEPAWSPDGTQIAFVSNATGTAQIYLRNVSGGQVTQLTSTASNFSPVWSPDGTKIAFVRFLGAGVGDDIWTMNRDGSNQTTLTSTVGIDELDPDWGVRP